MKKVMNMNLSRQSSYVVLLMLLWSSVLASAVPGRAEVRAVVGQATRINAVGASSPLATGMVLRAGDTVSTGPNSTVNLWLGINGDFLRVEADTALKFEVLDIASVSERRVTTRLRLLKGNVTGSLLTKLTAASKYELITADGTAEIRGTIYAFRNNGTLIVTKGVVHFSYVHKGVPNTVTVAPGQQFRPGDDGPTDASQKLLEDVADAVAQLHASTGTIRVGDLTVTVTDTVNPLEVSASGK